MMWLSWGQLIYATRRKKMYAWRKESFGRKEYRVEKNPSYGTEYDQRTDEDSGVIQLCHHLVLPDGLRLRHMEQDVRMMLYLNCKCHSALRHLAC